MKQLGFNIMLLTYLNATFFSVLDSNTNIADIHTCEVEVTLSPPTPGSWNGVQ